MRKDDEVEIVRGSFKGREGKITDVYRRKYVIHVEKITREKANGKFYFEICKPAVVVITSVRSQVRQSRSESIPRR